MDSILLSEKKPLLNFSLRAKFLWSVVILFFIGVGVWAFRTELPQTLQAQGILQKQIHYEVITSQTDAKIETVTVLPGHFVKKGQTIATLIETKQAKSIKKKKAKLKRFIDEYLDIVKIKTPAAKRRVKALESIIIGLKADIKSGTNDVALTIKAPYDGRIVELHIQNNLAVSQGADLYTIETQQSVDTSLKGYLFVTQLEAQSLQSGLPIHLSLRGFPTDKFGHLKGIVTGTQTRPLQQGDFERFNLDTAQSQQFLNSGRTILVTVDLQKSPLSPSGYAWSLIPGPSIQLFSGTSVDASITLGQVAPIKLVFPELTLASVKP